jgi:hypothetical protein
VNNIFLFLAVGMTVESCRLEVGLGKNGTVKKHYNTFNLHLEIRDQVG